MDFLVLAGYMRILSESFLRAYKDPRGFYRIVNIHPSLLPSFPGKSAYEDAFNYGVKVSGITIHLVDEKVDHGYILAQEAFPRFDDDTLATFKARGLAVEHKLFPEVLQTLANGELSFLTRELV
jgi:phosphoribosylglycinamide formyltransferase-1